MKTYNELLTELGELSATPEKKEFLEKAKEAVERNRLNLLARGFLAIAFEFQEAWLESFEQYSILYQFQKIYKEEALTENELLKKIEYTMNQAIAVLESLPAADQETYRERLLAVNGPENQLDFNPYFSKDELDDYLGLHIFSGQPYYIGRYDDWTGSYYNFFKKQNGTETKVEIYPVGKIGKEYSLTEGFPCILPVVSGAQLPPAHENQIELLYPETGKRFSWDEGGYRNYSYYRITEPAVLKMKNDAVFAKPVLLQHKKKKRLVLTLFWDSFNWKVIKEKSLQELMPNTYEFFKDGLICNEFYSGSEFTYPSIATYWTGLRSTHHHLLNENVHLAIPEHIPLLSEIFKDAGYMTAKIGGNGSVVPYYGYARGIDRFVYEEFEQNFHVQDAVNEAIEHMEAFRETDLFLWLDITDLHEVAGYWPMPLSVQAETPPEMAEMDHRGGSSLYQSPSPHRRYVYEKQLKRADRRMKGLYDYIRSNYNPEEVAVAMISDHGNGFNVDAGEYFMSVQRTNVPLLLYDGQELCKKPEENEQNECSELMETIDFSRILCKLAGIEDERLKGNDGSLPEWLGGKKKEYAFAHSLFPNRYYNAAVYTEAYEFYFQSETLVSNDCRVSLKYGTHLLRDRQGKSFEDDIVAARCMEIISQQLGDYEII